MRYKVTTTDELYHHGIKGQKWGVRRYQNKDRSLTKAGKIKYADNYSYAQRKRDEKLYGKHAVKRINKRLLDGEQLLSSRHDEVIRRDRINKGKRTVSKIIGTTTSLATFYTVYKFRQDPDKVIRNAKEMVSKVKDTPINLKKIITHN